MCSSAPPAMRSLHMTTPEWTTAPQQPKSWHLERCCIVSVLAALGVLAGIGLGIPIGREQQLRMDVQRTADTRQWQDEQSAGTEATQFRSMPKDSGAAAPLPPVPDIATLPATAQGAFNRFHCAAVGKPSTQCAALAVVQADSRFEPGSAAAPALRLGGSGGRYTDGQRVALAAKASAQFDGYLYVDYFDEEGNVIHL